MFCVTMTAPVEFSFHHSNYGASVRLSANATEAVRDSTSFGYAIVFGRDPLKVNHWISFELGHEGVAWSGALRVGLTSLSPDGPSRSKQDLPSHAFPTLHDACTHWIRPLPEHLIYNGCRLTLRLSSNGAFNCFVDGVHLGALFTDLPVTVPLWLLFDIYGNTTSVRVVPNSETPMEIVARGSRVLSAYQHACDSGTLASYRTRLMLVGEEGAGKTSLKNSLLGINPLVEEKTSNSGIDLSASFSINLSSMLDANKQHTWLPCQQRVHTSAHLFSSDCIDSYHESLKSEYNYALAENIVQELLSQENNGQELLSQERSITSHKSGVGTCRKNSKSGIFARTMSGFCESSASQSNNLKQHDTSSVASLSLISRPIASRLLQEMPDVVSRLVTEIMSQREASSSTTLPRRHSNINIDVWDFAGQAAYHAIHQIFLSYRAVYIIVFDLSQDLNAIATTSSGSCAAHGGGAFDHFNRNVNIELTHLDYIDYWINLIHLHTAENHFWNDSLLSNRSNRSSAKTTKNATELASQMFDHVQSLLPPILLVGTHLNSLGETDAIRETLAKEQFQRVIERIRFHSATLHLVPQCFSIETSLASVVKDSDPNIIALKSAIEEVIRTQPYMGEMIPLKWLRLQQRIEELVLQGTIVMPVSQLAAVAQEEGFFDVEDLFPALCFFNDLGIIIFYGADHLISAMSINSGNDGSVVGNNSKGRNYRRGESWSNGLDASLRDTVILEPRWLLEVFRAVVIAQPIDLDIQIQALSESWQRLVSHAILEEKLLDYYWMRFKYQKLLLIGLLERFDLIAKCLPNPSTNSISSLEKTFYVPSLLKRWTSDDGQIVDALNSVIFYYKFIHFVPDGLFQRILCRAIRWSQEQGGRDPVLFRNKAWFFVDQDHDFGLEVESLRHAKIKVSIYRVGAADDMNFVPPIPAQSVVAKVRNFLEDVLAEMRALWMRRLSYTAVVTCPCNRPCVSHQKESCQDVDCAHFLSLDECLASKIVLCGHRRLKSEQWRRWFLESKTSADAKKPSSADNEIKDYAMWNVVPKHVLADDVWNIEVQKGAFLPSWMKNAAKLLNGGDEGHDWHALAEKMGYNEKKIARFNEDLNPALILLADWVVSNGNTTLAVDMIGACLRDIRRNDIADVVEQERNEQEEHVVVFLSYQWDAQHDVQQLRSCLEQAGVTCWMDIGQMGGGDQLNARIDRALRSCSVVVACITPRYVISPLCVRELALADLLRKPIIPVMLERTPWPPPGPLALVLAQFIYIDMHGVGGHGGSGKHADREDRYTEILNQVVKYTDSTHEKTHEKEKIAKTNDAVEQNVYDDKSILYPRSASFGIQNEERLTQRHHYSTSIGTVDAVFGVQTQSMLQHQPFDRESNSSVAAHNSPSQLSQMINARVPLSSSIAVRKCAVCIVL